MFVSAFCLMIFPLGIAVGTVLLVIILIVCPKEDKSDSEVTRYRMSVLRECELYPLYDSLTRNKKIEFIEALLPDEKDENERAYLRMMLENMKRE